jgi:hypothetical protein
MKVGFYLLNINFDLLSSEALGSKLERCHCHSILFWSGKASSLGELVSNIKVVNLIKKIISEKLETLTYTCPQILG